MLFTSAQAGRYPNSPEMIAAVRTTLCPIFSPRAAVTRAFSTETLITATTSPAWSRTGAAMQITPLMEFLVIHSIAPGQNLCHFHFQPTEADDRLGRPPLQRPARQQVQPLARAEMRQEHLAQGRAVRRDQAPDDGQKDRAG